MLKNKKSGVDANLVEYSAWIESGGEVPEPERLLAWGTTVYVMPADEDQRAPE